MKNIILLTHGEFSKGIAQSCRFILGDVPNLTALSITLNESVAQTKAMIEDAWKAFGNSASTILITDIPGGSTTQSAIGILAEHPDFYLVSGLCLGLLLPLAMLELTDDREENLASIRTVLEEARDTLVLVNDVEATDALQDEEGEL